LIRQSKQIKEILMYPQEIRVNSPLEALVVEQALAMVREMKRVADAAPDGQVLSQAEKIAVTKGRELTRKSLEAVLNDQAEEVEKKGRVGGPARAEDHGNTEAGIRGRC
jgi:vancomycin resistance protein YoaR